MILALLTTLTLTIPQSYAVAQDKWGPAFCGVPALVDAPSPPDGPAGHVNVFQDGSTTDCTIYIDMHWSENVDATCDVIVHEWGHLTGHQHTHSGNPFDVMDGDGLAWFPPCHPPVRRFYTSFKEWDNADADAWYPAVPSPDPPPA